MREISNDVKRQIEFTAVITDSFETSEGFNIAPAEVDNPREVAQSVIQAYLTECWQVFDKDDEKTWPEKGVYYIRIIHNDGRVEVTDSYFDPTDDSPWNDIYDYKYSHKEFNKIITHYLDPADILPEGM